MDEIQFDYQYLSLLLVIFGNLGLSVFRNRAKTQLIPKTAAP